MRDSFLEVIYDKMQVEKDIFFLSDDMGAPVLDKIRDEFSDRFINVGISEQNMIGVATGLASEGYKVICYGIIPFFYRAFEQIRVDLVIGNLNHKMSVALVGVGAGLSYGVSGPTHHAIDDVAIFRSLPSLDIYSPSDYLEANVIGKNIFKNSGISYIRFDGQKMEPLYSSIDEIDIDNGFNVLHRGKKGVIVSTGTIIRNVTNLAKKYDLTLIDVFNIGNFNKDKLCSVVGDAKFLITLEEGFLYRGGFDTKINSLFQNRIKVYNFGFNKSYSFFIGSRELIFKKLGLDFDDLEDKLIEELS